VVYDTWAEMEVIGFCVPAGEQIGPGDRYIARQLAKVARRTPVIGVVTKTDVASSDQVAAQLVALGELLDFTGYVPVSAGSVFPLDSLSDALVAQLPPGPELSPDGDRTEDPERTLVAELIREAAREGVHDELPHSLAVTVEEM